MRSEIAQPCCGSRATALRISRSSVPWGSSMRAVESDMRSLPSDFDRSIADLLSKRKGNASLRGGRLLRELDLQHLDGLLDLRVAPFDEIRGRVVDEHVRRDAVVLHVLARRRPDAARPRAGWGCGRE